MRNPGRRHVFRHGSMGDYMLNGGISRRALLSAAAALPLAGQAETPGMIIRQKEPENLEFPFDSLNSFLTPNDRFYIRSHHPVPKLSAETWKLRVEGTLNKPLDLSYSELRAMPSIKVPATLECAGNSRVFLAPQVPGAQWELGAVSTAEWTGVPLSAVLDRAGLTSNALEVVLEGADQGEGKNDPHPAGAIHFARSIPIEKARRPEVVLAFQMNGKDLPPSHGYP
ncbi:MAG: molybdopterin-dependent oxidoreductase, partial [Acidobacteriota bacterium]|nr:molybdopterin-dependent oxidoreductase [Acidobacteriota bacterium]